MKEQKHCGKSKKKPDLQTFSLFFPHNVVISIVQMIAKKWGSIVKGRIEIILLCSCFKII